MSQDPSIEELKAQIKVEIPVDEEPMPEKETANGTTNVADELRNLGRQFAETLRTAWNSEERQKAEKEVREGVDFFVKEVEKVFREVKESSAAQKAKEEAAAVKAKVESGDLGRKARTGLADGLRRLSEGLNRLANQFTPTEKESEEQ